MTFFQFITHIFNGLAPAAFLAISLPLLGRGVQRFSKKKTPAGMTLVRQAVIVFTACLLAQGISLWGLGRDGKMLGYGGLVLIAATCQWVLLWVRESA